MKRYYFPVHLYLDRRRKKGHNPGPYLGQAFTVPRTGSPNIRVRLYRPAENCAAPLPALFNVHGGGWLFGDAEAVDLQSRYLANRLCCFVVNIDYRRLDEQPFPYQQREVADTVCWFLEHAALFGIDPARAALAGYSAGGHIAAGAAMLSPANASPAALRGLPPAVILSCGKNDPLLPQAEAYAEKLRAAGVKTVYREYKAAEHGFLEHNFPDDPAAFAGESEQDRLMREAVAFLQEQNIFTL